jgi:7-keto-8-aminopelargonate synthetase-like enzyme
LFYWHWSRNRNKHGNHSELQLRVFFVNPSTFPIVPLKNSGIRITLNVNHTEDMILKLLITIKDIFDSRKIQKNKELEAFKPLEKIQL